MHAWTTCDRNVRGLGRGFCPRRVLARGGIIVSPMYTYKECVKYWCSMRINPDLKKLVATVILGNQVGFRHLRAAFEGQKFQHAVK